MEKRTVELQPCTKKEASTISKFQLQAVYATLDESLEPTQFFVATSGAPKPKKKKRAYTDKSDLLRLSGRIRKFDKPRSIEARVFIASRDILLDKKYKALGRGIKRGRLMELLVDRFQGNLTHSQINSALSKNINAYRLLEVVKDG